MERKVGFGKILFRHFVYQVNEIHREVTIQLEDHELIYLLKELKEYRQKDFDPQIEAVLEELSNSNQLKMNVKDILSLFEDEDEDQKENEHDEPTDLVYELEGERQFKNISTSLFDVIGQFKKFKAGIKGDKNPEEGVKNLIKGLQKISQEMEIKEKSDN